MAHLGEKDHYSNGYSSGVDTRNGTMAEVEKEHDLVDRNGSVGEAAATYGDVGTAEETGYVRRA